MRMRELLEGRRIPSPALPASNSTLYWTTSLSRAPHYQVRRGGVLTCDPGQTDISNVLFKDFDVTIKNDKLNTSGVTDLKLENVIVNGKPYSV